MTRLSGILAAFAVALSSLLAVPTASATPPPVSPSVRRAILAGHHPYLHRFCHGDLMVLPHAIGVHRGRKRLLVVQVTCTGATAATPIDTGVYSADGHQRYLLDRGRTIHRGKFDILAVSMRAGHGNRLVLRYGGYGPRDALCCPSRLYNRTFRLWQHHFTKGTLHRVMR
jgi:hypothetical protein